MALGLMTVGVLCLLIAVHPFTTYPFSLWLLRRWLYAPLPKEEPRDSELTPADMALCMCAYNEEKVIEGKIENLLALKRANPGLEVLIYVDAASERTAEILRAYEDEFRLHISPERHG
jgi:cellulose synthase/poly-beta-1,6-N-acetylglucosamine synthase-like glycosyltransferase